MLSLSSSARTSSASRKSILLESRSTRVSFTFTRSASRNLRARALAEKLVPGGVEMVDPRFIWSIAIMLPPVSAKAGKSRAREQARGQRSGQGSPDTKQPSSVSVHVRLSRYITTTTWRTGRQACRALPFRRAIRIERVVDDPLRRIERVVVLVAEMAEAFGDRLQARSLRLDDRACCRCRRR